MIGYYEAKVPADNSISSEVISSLAHFLEELDYDLYRFIDRLFTWADDGSPWRQWLTEDGKWTKRFAAAYKRGHDKAIGDDIMGKIGDFLGGRINTSDKTLHFEIAKFSDWVHGSFEGKVSKDGKPPGACWWNDYRDFRLGLSRHPDGYSVLFYGSKISFERYSKEKGIGRCWMYNSKHGKVIFNAYGINLRAIAQALCTTFGETSKQIKISSPTGAWINTGFLDNEGRGGGKVGLGFLIGKLEDIIEVSSVTLPDFSAIPDTECTICHAPISARKSTIVGNEHVCDECVNQLVKCKFCGNYELPSDKKYELLLSGDKRQSCKRCYDVAKVCTKHGKVRHNVHRIWHTQRTCCDWCVAMKDVARCENCYRFFDKYVTVRMQQGHISHKLCVSCHSKLEVIKHG